MASDSLNRRELAVRLVTGAAALHVATGSDEHAVLGAPQKPEQATAASPIDLWWELVRRQYPDPRLDEAAYRDEIRSELETQISRSKALSRFPLANGDEPGFAFGAYRGN